MAVGYLYDPLLLTHDTGDHPESPQRLATVMERLEACALLPRLRRLEAQPATEADLARVHAPAMIERVRALADLGGGAIDLDTRVSSGSYAAACLASGAVLAGCRAVLAGEVSAAYALVRPPGHHATDQRSMGFCLFNHVAVAAAWCLTEGNLSRVAVVDYDVHHGNGTEAILGDNPRALYLSTHLYPFYPGTGHWRDGRDAPGKRSCVNIPLPPNTGDKGLALAFERVVLPALERFRPELILVSSGYDGHWADPLAWMLVSVEGYRRLVRLLRDAAEALCGGRLVLALEGGYQVHALGHCVAATFAELLGLPYDDPLGRARHPEVDVGPLVEQVAHFHGLDRAAALGSSRDAPPTNL